MNSMHDRTEARGMACGFRGCCRAGLAIQDDHVILMDSLEGLTYVYINREERLLYCVLS